MTGNFRIDDIVKLAGMAMLVALAGCAAPAPQVVTRTVTVEVPVGVPCRAPQIERPVWPLDVLPTDANDYEFARAALTEIEMRNAYEARLEGAVAGCK
jgi:hypothetical protein